jgi:hypothetical protein
MGAISRSRDECRDARGIRRLEDVFQDLRYAFRSMKRSKALALGVVISIGLGIGATASVFSFVDGALFRLLSVPDTNRVVRITNSTPASSFGNFSYPEYQDYLERNQTWNGTKASSELQLTKTSPKGWRLSRATNRAWFWQHW